MAQKITDDKPDTEKPVKRLNPLNDYLFLKMMGEPGDEDQLLGFLNAVLTRTRKDPLVSVEIIENRTITAEIIGDKTSVLDVRAKTGDGTRVNIEVQLKNLDNMDKRSLFYWSLGYTRNIEVGDDYEKLPNVIAINIVNFEHLETRDFHASFHLREDTERDYILTEALEIHFIDMVKFKRLREKDIKNDTLQRWMTYFNQDSPAEVVEEIVQMDAAIQKAETKMDFVSKDKEALRAYQMRAMAMSDLTSAINKAKREGEKQKAIEIARKMKADKEPGKKIMAYTDLTQEEIDGI
ncbi:Rpn family recombination-promoting nuclease/putative transposase [Treponema primitia]|uniref:Rpn family recombination-promoting nuclease/putative transposase n=1 Tax=Treponema primitia TaxID=88058 RepID=UPI0002554CF7|nr:Rpn family recombination-promoting nuclease/putative transposase [Treponema primitia]